MSLTNIATPSEKELDAFANTVQNFKLDQYLLLLALFVGCLVVMKILLKILDKTMNRLKVERSLHNFIRSIIRALLWLVTVILVLGYMGVNPTSLIAILGVVGLAISLAIQGTLSNLAGGIMILVSKPFVGGDYIETDSVGGTVSEIGMVYTKIKTFDNKSIFIPNGQMSTAKIINYTREEARRVDLKFCTAYGDDLEKVKACILQVVGQHPKALFTPEPFVRMSALKESSVEYAVRVWCATDDYWDLYSDLLEQIYTAFSREGIRLTYSHLNVHLVEGGSQSGI